MFFWRLVSTLLLLYMLLIAMRVLLSWFSASVHGRYWHVLLRLTDPYLNLFRGLAVLHRGAFDFTVVAAVLVLVVAKSLVDAVLVYGRITLGLLASLLVGAVWSGVSFLIVLFLLLAVLRLLTLQFARRYDSPIGGLLEAMVRPAVTAVRGLLPRGWQLKESYVLLTVVAALTVILLLGGLGFNWLRLLLRGLPV